MVNFFYDFFASPETTFSKKLKKKCPKNGLKCWKMTENPPNFQNQFELAFFTYVQNFSQKDKFFNFFCIFHGNIFNFCLQKRHFQRNLKKMPKKWPKMLKNYWKSTKFSKSVWIRIFHLWAKFKPKRPIFCLFFCIFHGNIFNFCP